MGAFRNGNQERSFFSGTAFPGEADRLRSAPCRIRTEIKLLQLFIPLKFSPPILRLFELHDFFLIFRKQGNHAVKAGFLEQDIGKNTTAGHDPGDTECGFQKRFNPCKIE